MEAIHPKYKTFWRRLGASILDALILAPLIIIFYYLSLKLGPAESELFSSLFAFLVYGSYSVIMTAKYGATVGKMAAGIMVLDGDDERSYIGIRRAIKRDSPLFIADILGIIYMLITLENHPEGFEDTDVVLRFIHSLSNIWVIAELMSMLGNERRRAIHDILANSVVIKEVKVYVSQK